jgi:leucyl/phenylalanyl-tRNA--protein transferase
METGETTGAGALRETLEEAGARRTRPAVFDDRRRTSSRYIFFRARLLDLLAPGDESLEVQLFQESAVPWAEIAFRTVAATLRHFSPTAPAAASACTQNRSTQAWQRHAPARMIPWLAPGQTFPAVDAALRAPNGLLAASAELSIERLLAGYAEGIFPWYSEGEPVLWWSPDPRMVLLCAEFKVSRSLQKTLRRCAREPAIEVVIDRAFTDVVRACSAPRADGAGTWITPEVMHAYGDLHERGLAHSVETWVDGAWRAVFTALAWAGCSSANRCSRVAQMPRRSRSLRWFESCWTKGGDDRLPAEHEAPRFPGT